jgi:hypothetical protein
MGEAEDAYKREQERIRTTRWKKDAGPWKKK